MTKPMYRAPRHAGGRPQCPCCGEMFGKEQVKGREEQQWRKDFTDEITAPEPAYCWEYDGPNEWESRDLLHRLADDDTIARYMGGKP